MKYEELSAEQQKFVSYAVGGQNILVDACIGSGKTTAIQTLCDCLPGKRILYLTYNKLLKLDAKSKIKNHNVYVTNYHGFAYSELLKEGIRTGLSEIIQVYNKKKPNCAHYDVLVLDEYQDIEQEIADMLEHVKACCEGIQIVAVGDMAQKIYDKTRLDVRTFITGFLGDYVPMEFTNCFRINGSHAEMLGRIWEKDITGTNSEFEMRILPEYKVRNLAAGLRPSQLLVLGSKAGKAQELQNYLETKHLDTFNKQTLWSKIKDGDGATNPNPECAIFTTYDGCKGMERDVCILYDWSQHYWEMRLNKPDTKYEILRNIFCVAASRAKRLLIIVDTDGQLTEDDLMDAAAHKMPYQDMAVSEMFDFKFIEDVEDAYHSLDIREIQPAGDVIDVPLTDELIDLSPCIGHYQEASYFSGYDIDHDLEYSLCQSDRSYMRRDYKNYTIDQKLLYLAALETRQQRYMNQVRALPISEKNRERIHKRLATHLAKDVPVQKDCSLPVCEPGSGSDFPLFHIHGIADALKGGVVYELKFTKALSHVHALQIAMYLVCLGNEVGRLWNVRTDQMLEIRIPDRERFLGLVMNAITKGRIKEFCASEEQRIDRFIDAHMFDCMECFDMAKTEKITEEEPIHAFFKERGLTLPGKAVTFLGLMKRGQVL